MHRLVWFCGPHPSRFVEPRLSISLPLASSLCATPLFSSSSSSSALLLARCAWSSLRRALRISSWHESTSDSSPLSFHPPLGGSSKPSRPSACSSHPLLAPSKALLALFLLPFLPSFSTSVRFLFPLAAFLSFRPSILPSSLYFFPAFHSLHSQPSSCRARAISPATLSPNYVTAGRV